VAISKHTPAITGIAGCCRGKWFLYWVWKRKKFPAFQAATYTFGPLPSFHVFHAGTPACRLARMKCLWWWTWKDMEHKAAHPDPSQVFAQHSKAWKWEKPTVNLCSYEHTHRAHVHARAHTGRIVRENFKICLYPLSVVLVKAVRCLCCRPSVRLSSSVSCLSVSYECSLSVLLLHSSQLTNEIPE
jgi:hypothetical protein